MLYIDGDILPYQIGFATQRSVYELSQEGLHTVSPFLTTNSKRVVNKYPEALVDESFYVEEPAQVIATLKLHLRNIVAGGKCDHFKVVLSGPTNFRDSIASIKPYKGNRTGSEKPVNFHLIRDWLLDKSYTIVSDHEEADDVLSKAMMDGHTGATLDKDLNNTPGMHYNFKTNKLYEVSELEAIQNFYKQMLTGDSADNIPGISGIGPKTASELIDHQTLWYDMEKIVYEKYTKVYKDPIAAMTEVGQLLWMRRKDNEMWTPSVLCMC